jgi:aminopeptidase N
VRFVDTDDVVAAASAAAGEDLGWFFDVYVRQAALPRLEERREGGVLRLSWITPDDLPFRLAVPVRLGGEDVRVEMPGGKGELQVGDRDVVVDPRRQLLVQRSGGRR